MYFDPIFQKKIKKKNINELIKMLINLKGKKLNNFEYVDAFWILTSAILNKNIDMLSHHKNVIIVDPINILLKNKNNFIDYMHLTKTGNSIIAKEIYNKLNTNLEK